MKEETTSEFDGTVEPLAPNGCYRVTLDNGHQVARAQERRDEQTLAGVIASALRFWPTTRRAPGSHSATDHARNQTSQKAVRAIAEAKRRHSSPVFSTIHRPDN
jgi:hypothetical protein